MGKWKVEKWKVESGKVENGKLEKWKVENGKVEKRKMGKWKSGNAAHGYPDVVLRARARASWTLEVHTPLARSLA